MELRNGKNYKVSKVKTHSHKFAPILALIRYPVDLIGRAKLLDTSAANQSQGGKFLFSQGIFRLAR